MVNATYFDEYVYSHTCHPMAVRKLVLLQWSLCGCGGLHGKRGTVLLHRVSSAPVSTMVVLPKECGMPARSPSRLRVVSALRADIAGSTPSRS